MRREAALLLGTHDFAAFRGRNDFRTETVRTISDVAITESPLMPRCLQIRVTGNRFLYHMMRIISGTLVDVGRGKCPPQAVSRAIASGDRLELGMTAPAAGLCLENIVLRTQGTDEWPYHLDGEPAVDGTALQCADS
jgi:tRNA pseudouridine38-40 synthase